MVNLAILLSSDYALVNLDQYHCRRLTRILNDENIFGRKPDYMKTLVEDEPFKFGLKDTDNHNCSTELKLDYDLADILKSDPALKIMGKELCSEIVRDQNCQITMEEENVNIDPCLFYTRFLVPLSKQQNDLLKIHKRSHILNSYYDIHKINIIRMGFLGKTERCAGVRDIDKYYSCKSIAKAIIFQVERT